MKKISLLILCVLGVHISFSQANKALSLIDGMQKKYKNMGAFSANFTYQTDGSAAMTGSITVRGTKFRLKTAGQEIFNNGKEVATFIKEINEVNLAAFDPTEGDLNPAKIYSFDKKAYKTSVLSEAGGVSTVEMVPLGKTAQIQKISLKIGTKDFSIKDWTIVNKAGKRQNFKVTQLIPKAGLDDKYFTFDKKQFQGVEVNDLR